MTEQEKKPQNLKAALALDDEIQDWRDYIGTKCVRTAQKRDDAQENGDYALAKKLDQEWKQWVDLKHQGYSHAEETELGRQTLAYIRDRRQRIEAPSPLAEEREKEKRAWDVCIDNLWGALSEKILAARTSGDQGRIKELLKESEELGRIRTAGYSSANETKLGREILQKIRGKD